MLYVCDCLSYLGELSAIGAFASEADDKVQLQSSSAVSLYNNEECTEKVQVCLT